MYEWTVRIDIELVSSSADLNIFIMFQEYAINLAKQLGVGSIKKEVKLGKDLQLESIDKFRDEQVHQLHELYKTAKGLEDQEEGKK